MADGKQAASMGNAGGRALGAGKGPGGWEEGGHRKGGRASWEGKWVLSVGKRESHFRLVGEVAIVLERGVVRKRHPKGDSEAVEDPG